MDDFRPSYQEKWLDLGHQTEGGARAQAMEAWPHKATGPGRCERTPRRRGRAGLPA
ncbi:hypothetical protein TIFTF001_005572 [Ficus carica]|uniref:Uncharacterized protein n=1 Tax=Ficus carica TaxID=3494 RepID=A0AA88CYT3_FICCA|nr:hypothetical protein TIFTF001_005572 [Ficus carica]